MSLGYDVNDSSNIIAWLEIVDIVKDIDSEDVMDLVETKPLNNMYCEHMFPMYNDPFEYSNECTVEGWDDEDI